MLNKYRLLSFIIFTTIFINHANTSNASQGHSDNNKHTHDHHAHNNDNTHKHTSKSERLYYDTKTSNYDWEKSKDVLNISNKQAKELMLINKTIYKKHKQARNKAKESYLAYTKSISQKEFNNKQSLKLLDIYLKKEKEQQLLMLELTDKMHIIFNDKNKFKKFIELSQKEPNFI